MDARQLKLPRGSQSKTGELTLVSGPKRTRMFKAAILTSHLTARERFEVFRIAR